MRSEPRATDDTWLWVAAIMGPLAWLSDLAASWWVQIGGHDTDLAMLRGMTAVALALTLAAAGIAADRLRRRRTWPLAQASLAISVMSMLLLIGTSLRAMP